MSTRRALFDDLPDYSSNRLASTQRRRTRRRSLSARGRRTSLALALAAEKRKEKRRANMARRTRYRRSFYSRGNMSTKVPKNIRQNVAGLLNAHATVRPRIMDGAATESQTHNNRATFSFNIPQNGTGIFMLCPNVLVPLFYKVSGVGLPLAVENYHVDGHCDSAGMALAAGNPGHVDMHFSIDKWRVVSQALRLKLLNTDDTNDGWFESYRLTSKIAMYNMELADSGIVNECYMRPNAATVDYYGTSLAGNKERHSYTCGPVKDIDKFQFHLNPYAETHPFIQLDKVCSIEDFLNRVAGPPQYWTITSNFVDSWQRLFKQLEDSTWDVVVCIVHASSDAGGTNVLIDCAQNLEVVYENDSNRSRYHEPAVAAPSIQNAVHQHQTENRVAAATPVAGGAAANITPGTS